MKYQKIINLIDNTNNHTIITPITHTVCSVVFLSAQDNTKLLELLKSKKQPTGTNINQKYQHKHKISIQITRLI